MADPDSPDYNATTPVAREVPEAMLPRLREQFGNPSSTHSLRSPRGTGHRTARRQVAELIGAQPQEIVPTGCATEANNLALLGVARRSGHPTAPRDQRDRASGPAWHPRWSRANKAGT